MEEHRNQSDTDALLEELLRETEEHTPAEPDQPPVPEEPGECPAEPVSDPEPEPESDMEKTQSFQSVKHVQEAEIVPYKDNEQIKERVFKYETTSAS